MNCPQCGLYLPDMNVERCPRCGWTRATSAGAVPPPDYNPWANPGASPASSETPPWYASSQNTPTPGWPSYAPGTSPSSMYPPAQQSAPDQASPYSQGSQSGMSPYGSPAQPSVPMYGQAAPPSVPMYGQYGQYAPPSVPMYGQAAPPSMGQQPPWGAPYPPQPPQKSRTGLIVGLVLVIVLILGAGGGFLVLHANQQNGGTGGNNANATATVPAATATPSNVVFQDSFTDPNSGWSNDSHCSYGSGGYHIKDGYICFAPAGDFTDATITATAKQISGSLENPYGIDFRIGSQTNYEFDIDGSGDWAVAKCGSTDCTPLVDFKSNAAIHRGMNVTNTLTVTMQGSHFAFSVNGTQVGSASDTAYTSGKVGISASQGIEVVYSSFQVMNA